MIVDYIIKYLYVIVSIVVPVSIHCHSKRRPKEMEISARLLQRWRRKRPESRLADSADMQICLTGLTCSSYDCLETSLLHEKEEAAWIACCQR
jgi:hypothetical protein